MDVILRTGNHAYTLEYEHKNGWNADVFKERYSEVLERYDYIVGDWGYNQLRLRGFYQEGHPRATKETTISSLVDYLNEYCNFGCAYFVLRKSDAKLAPAEPEDELPSASATGETAAAQAAELTAAAAAAATPNGMLMRWPLKERLGGPVRMPGAAAVARAAAEAERRQLLQNQAASASVNKPADPRQAAVPASDYNGGRSGSGSGNRHAAANGHAERRPYGGGSQAGQADSRYGSRPGQNSRGPRSGGNHADRQSGGGPAKSGGSNWRQAITEPNRPAPEPARASDAGNQKTEAAKNGSRWSGKNRRKGRFGGKPPRPDALPREEGNSDRQAGE